MTTHGPIYQMVEKMSKQRTMGDDLSIGRVLGFEELLPKIQELEPAWIPVTEKLPESYGEYIISVDIDGEPKTLPMFFSKRSESLKAFESIAGVIYYATHWMELPQPPK